MARPWGLYPNAVAYCMHGISLCRKPILILSACWAAAALRLISPWKVTEGIKTPFMYFNLHKAGFTCRVIPGSSAVFLWMYFLGYYEVKWKMSTSTLKRMHLLETIIAMQCWSGIFWLHFSINFKNFPSKLPIWRPGTNPSSLMLVLLYKVPGIYAKAVS